MDGRYLRNLSALTEGECRLLRSKRILVVGCGGLGGYIIEMLTRIGVGAIRAVDGDRFEESNLNRQLLSAPELLGNVHAAPSILTAFGEKEGVFRTPGGEKPFAMYRALSELEPPAYFGFAFD